MFNLSRLFPGKKPLVIEDPVFGRLEYDRSTWCALPRPQGHAFMISLDAPESGPCDSQRQLFHTLVEDLPALKQRAIEYLERNDVVGAKLYLYSIELGSGEESARGEFVMEFTTEDESLIHRVMFSGFEPVEYGCDD
jgi:hypothetical protein